MGKLTKTMCAVGAAAAMASPVKAQLTRTEEGVRLFSAIVDVFAVDQVERSPEFEQLSAQYEGGKITEQDALKQKGQMIRAVYANQLVEHRDNLAALQASTQLIAQKGLDSPDMCRAAFMKLSTLGDQENLFGFYDYRVIRGEVPGPMLRSGAERATVANIMQQHTKVLQVVCRKYGF